MISRRLVSALRSSPFWCTPPVNSIKENADAEETDGFDAAWYFRFHAGQMVSCTFEDCLSHYQRNCGTMRVSPNLAFNESWYRHRYPEVDEAVKSGRFASGWRHYLQEGCFQGYNPSFWFEESYYQRSNPEVKEAVSRKALDCGFEHFLLYGIYRDLDPSLYFNTSWYRAQYVHENARGQRGFPLTHYLLSPDRLRRSTVPFFDEAWYRNQYLKSNGQAGANALEHYLVYGRRLGHSPSPNFNERAYVEGNPEVRRAIESKLVGSGFEHYLLRGAAQGLVPSTHLAFGGVDYSGPDFLAEYERSLRLNLQLSLWLRSLAGNGRAN